MRVLSLLSLLFLASLAHADGYSIRKASSEELKYWLSRGGPPGPALRRQLRRMDKMLATPGAIPAVGAWGSPHVGTSIDLGPGPRSSGVRSTQIHGVADLAGKLFRGVHITDAGELIGVTIHLGSGRTTAVRDGASPLIGAARHVAKDPPPGTTVLRAWNKGPRGRSSIGYETRYVKGQPPARRTHLVEDRFGGQVDAGPDYYTTRDAHTGRVVTSGLGRSTYGAGHLNVAGVDPWEGD